MLAGLIKFQNAPGRLDVEAAKLVFQIFQVERGDAVILCAEKKQCHGRIPRKVEGFGQNQQGFPVPVHKGSFDHIARQRTQQGKPDSDLFQAMRPRVPGDAVFVQVALLVLRRHHPFCDIIGSRYRTELGLQLARDIGHRRLNLLDHAGTLAFEPFFNVI